MSHFILQVFWALFGGLVPAATGRGNNQVGSSSLLSCWEGYGDAFRAFGDFSTNLEHLDEK